MEGSMLPSAAYSDPSQSADLLSKEEVLSVKNSYQLNSVFSREANI